MAKQIKATDITRLYKFADEDRTEAFSCADVGAWKQFDDFMHCAKTHEAAARHMKQEWQRQARF